LKPGQVSLDRQLYQQEVKDNEETYFETDIEKGSVYMKQMVQRLVPTDYHNPQKPIRQTEPPPGEGHHGTGHWKSEYRSNVNDAARFDTMLYRQNGPSFQVANPPTCVGGGNLLSTSQEQYGLYGHDPRNKLVPGQTKMPTLKSALTVGTTKGTAHIPGYQGFMATNTTNPKVATSAHGGNMRSTDKSNLTQTYRTNMVGYCGHQPENARNDFGGLRPSKMTTHGRDFAPPPAECYM
jgi:hypothetical protein